MKGSKYLSEMVDVSLLKKDKLNIIKAPTGSGKTYFALTHIPALVHDAVHNVVFLIDTINGKEQILRNYNAISEYYGWAKEADENGMWFDDDNNVVILTYAKFGTLSQRYTDFHANFDYRGSGRLRPLLSEKATPFPQSIIKVVFIIDKIKDLPNEEWREIKGYSGKYLVSNMGRIKSLKHRNAKLLTAFPNNKGYPRVALCKDG